MQNLEVLQKKLDNYQERLSNIEQEINKFDEQELPESTTMRRKYVSFIIVLLYLSIE